MFKKICYNNNNLSFPPAPVYWAAAGGIKVNIIIKFKRSKWQMGFYTLHTNIVHIVLPGILLLITLNWSVKGLRCCSKKKLQSGSR